MRSKELSVDLRDRIMLRHKSGEGYQNMSAALKVPKNTVTSIILIKWKKFGTTKTLPRAGRLSKLSNRGRRALVRQLTKHPMVTLTELQRCGDRRTFQKDNHFWSMYATNQAFTIEWPDGGHSSVKGT